MNPLLQPVSVLDGIGAQTARRFEKLGVSTLQDLLFHLPIRYEDRTRITPIGALTAGMTALIVGRIECADILPRGRKSLIVRITDDTGWISVKFFHYSASQFHAFVPGSAISCYGEARYGYAGLEMTHPDYRIIPDAVSFVPDAHLTPVYPLTEGLGQHIIRKAVKQALKVCLKDSHLLIDWLPERLLQAMHFPGLNDAIQALHNPLDPAASSALQNGSHPALKRLAFEEMLTHYLSLRLAKSKNQDCQAPILSGDPVAAAHFIRRLPFPLTGAQQRVIAEITENCRREHPMMRLVQGDVGSGKTVVAAYAALLAISSGYQTAVMAPTELLAEQHYLNFSSWFASFETTVVLLNGQLKNKQRNEILEAMKDGSAHIVIGTHALFQEGVEFQKLGLCIIDEQHRFGVHQRLALREKGRRAGIRPHQLVMTATPIPRTLAMLQYADLDISVIDELPPGRKPVVTSVIPADRREDIIARISHWVAEKKQAYWVCTLIEESEVLQCEAAEKTADVLTASLPEVRVALLHGRMKSAEKDAIMQDFKNQQIDLLVATTVIEVGVDVPNAGLMIIENAERLGLSQLHQLRGRVGRGNSDSYCLLLYQPPLSDTARQRLGILRDSNDGFVIAEKDLELRGPGEVLGTRQTGAVHFKIADLSRDAELLDNIQEIGEQFFREATNAIQPLCDRWLGASTAYAEV